jgi:glycosyltransferase involved in cell wall biosynthesis
LVIPVVSILIIAGTGRPYLRAALDSLRQQDLSDWEALIIECCVNETDSDRVRATIAEVADDRMRLMDYPSERGYPPYASRKWNFGLKSCAAPLIAFLDDDDEKGPGWLSAMCAPLVAQEQLATTLSWGFNIDSAGAEHGRLFVKPSLSWQALTKPDFVTTGQVVVRRSIIDEISGFDEALACAEDWDLFLRLSKHPWHYVDSVQARKRDRCDNACYHPEVGGHTQEALRRIITKHNLAPDCCEGCGSTMITFVRAVPNKGFRLWCGADCARRRLD